MLESEKILGVLMGVAIGGLVSFLFALFLVLIIFSTLWVIFVRVILPLGLIVLLCLGIYWAYEKITSPKEEALKVIAPQQEAPQEVEIPPIILEEKI